MFVPNRFKPYQPDLQTVISLEQALPADHPVHVFIDLVASIDLDHFVTPPGPKGEKPYHPHALFGILAWGYLHGVRSSRRLARLARQEATFVYLAGGGRPNYRTLARFRRENAAAFSAVFEETVLLAFRLGLAKLGQLALDGTKLKAASSKHKAMSYGRMQRREAELKAEIAQLLEQAEAQDQSEDQEFGTESDGYAVAEELAFRAARLAKIQALREGMEAEKRQAQGLSEDETPEIAAKEQRSFADPDARIMPMKRGGYDYAYNAQAVVDAESGVMVVAELTNAVADSRHLPALVDEVRTLRAAVGLEASDPTIVSADAGYFSGENAAEDGQGLDLLIAAGRDDPAASLRTGEVYTLDCFSYDPERDVWICPGEQRLVLPEHQPGTMGRPVQHRYQADPADCTRCALREHCLKPDQEYRTVEAQGRRATGAMRYKMRQPEARQSYARRKTIVEPVFGQLKENRGFTGVSLRGLTLATGEYLLACLAHNLGKLLRVCVWPRRTVAMAA
jgi:transposase